MPSFYYINSKDRTIGDKHDYVIQTERFLDHMDDVRAVRLTEITFTNGVYPVNSNTNTLLFQEDGANDFSATIPSGSYEPATLAPIIKTAMENAGAGTYTVTFDAITYTFTISVAGGASTFYIKNALVGSTFSELIGLENVVQFPAASQTTGIVNLNGTDYIDVYTNLENNNISTAPIYHRGYLLARIPLNCPFGSIIYWPNRDESVIHTTSNVLNEINIAYYDDKDRPWATEFDSAITLEINEITSN